jgi:coenzyme A diphosphatase NUDT7
MDPLHNLIKHLPQSPNVLGKDRYVNTVVLVPLVMLDNEYHLLFEKRNADIRQGSEICFPGGKYDPTQDKGFQDTAVRETIEEIGIARNKITIKGQLDTIVAAMGITVDSFLAVLTIKSPDELRINKAEVETVFTLPLSYFKKTTAEEYQVRLEIQPSFIDENGKEIVLFPTKALGLPERYHHSWGHKQYGVLVYKTHKGVIWGLTAQIIHEISRWIIE